MAQSGVILNVQHQLEDILNNQTLMLQNQQDMIEKLTDIEGRLLDLEARFTVNGNGSVTNGLHSAHKALMSHQLLLNHHHQQNNHHPINPLKAGIINNHVNHGSQNSNNNNHTQNHNNNNNNNNDNRHSNDENSDNNSTNNQDNYDYDQDYDNGDVKNDVMNDDTDTYNENNESMNDSNNDNDSFEYNDQSQQSLNVSNSFTTNPNISLTNPNLLNDNEVKRIFTIAKSRGNFAALLVQQLYGKHERIISNVMGTRGKRQLSPRRIGIVKKLTFKMYPATHQNEEDMIWKKECVKAIDSKNRKVKILPGTLEHMSMATMQTIFNNKIN